MPRQKRTLDETTANEQPTSKKSKNSTTAKAPEKENIDPKTINNKKQTETKKSNKADTKQKKNDKDQAKDDEEPDFPPYDYVCMPRPFYDWEAENEAKDEDDQLDEEELEDKFDASVGKGYPTESPLKDNPTAKWICMWEAWRKFCLWKVAEQHRDQDNFGMHIYNDWTGYGQQECIENMIVAFDKEFLKKDKNLRELWAISVAMAHWLTQVDTQPWGMCDDSDRVFATIKVVGVTFLSVLNELDLAGELKADSEFKDLGLVMAVYLSWMPVGLDDINDESCIEWRKDVVACAKRANIDLSKSVVFGMEEILKKLGEEQSNIKALTGKASADRWKYKKTMAEFESKWNHGGDHYNILKMSKAERKKRSLDGKDPLAGVPQKAIDQGMLTLA